MTDTDDMPPLHPIRAERIPHDSWRPAAMEPLPEGWVNVRIWSYDETINRDLYTIEPCPGVMHFESAVTETVIQYADPDDNLYSEWGEPYDERPVVIDTAVAEPPWQHREFVDPTWKPAYLGGGYLGSCPAEKVRDVLVEHGFADAIPRNEADR